MSPADLMGWLAAGSTLLAFNSTNIVKLRLLAIVANICFIGFALEASIHSILCLHAVLLPLNIWRLLQTPAPAAAVRKMLEPSHGIPMTLIGLRAEARASVLLTAVMAAFPLLAVAGLLIHGMAS